MVVFCGNSVALLGAPVGLSKGLVGPRSLRSRGPINFKVKLQSSHFKGRVYKKKHWQSRERLKTGGKFPTGGVGSGGGYLPLKKNFFAFLDDSDHV